MSLTHKGITKKQANQIIVITILMLTPFHISQIADIINYCKPIESCIPDRIRPSDLTEPDKLTQQSPLIKEIINIPYTLIGGIAAGAGTLFLYRIVNAIPKIIDKIIDHTRPKQ